MDASGLTTIVTAFGGLAVSLLGYLGYRTRRDRLATIAEAFDDVLAGCASADPERRLAAAILLRRFFDRSTEVGVTTWSPRRPWRFERRAPFAQESVDVIAALVRELPTGNLQKLLADGLRYAPSLDGADLQRTNLEDAYLAGVSIDGTDFFRASLGAASLSRAHGKGATFKAARLRGTVFRGATLHEANFEAADLTGADFEDADLTRASFVDADLQDASFTNAKIETADFTGARNLSESLRDRLGLDGTETEGSRPAVFLSAPSDRAPRDDAVIAAVRRQLDDLGLCVEVFERDRYPATGGTGEVLRVLRGCVGLVGFGFASLEVASGTNRPRTASATEILDERRSAPWVQIEAGMAIALGLPLLLVADDTVSDGIFDPSLRQRSVQHVSIDEITGERPDWDPVRHFAIDALDGGRRGAR